MTFPALSASILTLGILLSFSAGCSPKPPASTGPSPREKELMATVRELREKLAVAEQEIQLAKAAAAKATPVPVVIKSETPEKNAESPASESETKIIDTSYIVVKKTFIPGKLISKRTSSQPNATERQPADCRITFKGVPSGKEYPELEVQEVAYGRFREGVAYSPQDIILAKKIVAVAAPAKNPTASSSPGVKILSAEEARSIFGD
jgi:hypothetical protein